MRLSRCSPQFCGAEARACAHAGATLGGGQGTLAAIRTRPELGVDTARLRLNRVLNLGGKTGRAAGNALGALGLFYASAESGLDYLNDGRAPDVANSLGAGTSSCLVRDTRFSGPGGCWVQCLPVLSCAGFAVQSGTVPDAAGPSLERHQVSTGPLPESVMCLLVQVWCMLAVQSCTVPWFDLKPMSNCLLIEGRRQVNCCAR